MASLSEIKAFDVPNADVVLWVFKKSLVTGKPPKFTGRYVETAPELDKHLKQIVSSEIERIEEDIEYGLLSQNHETSVLTMGLEETHADQIVEESKEEIEERQVKTTKNIINTEFYAIKLVQNSEVLLAVSKSDSSWKTKRAKNMLPVFYTGEQMDIDDSPSFDISRHSDFLIYKDKLFIINKDKFESVTHYKEAHKSDFENLLKEPEFMGIFSDLSEFKSFVGDNKIHLRRACAIRQKGHYKDLNFMSRLRQKYSRFRLNINFDDSGKIVPCKDTCRDIIQALLDHRLESGFSETVYDVPDTQAVNQR